MLRLPGYPRALKDHYRYEERRGPQGKKTRKGLEVITTLKLLYENPPECPARQGGNEWRAGFKGVVNPFGQRWDFIVLLGWVNDKREHTIR